MHLCFTPITIDGRLTAKEIIGNKSELIKWQDEFFAHMVSVYLDLERGESASETGRRHIPTSLFKQSVSLSKEAVAIRKELADINPLNANKKRDMAVDMLEKWFPKMEKFEAKLRKYQRSIDNLEKENVELSQKAKDGNANKIKTQLEIGKLKGEITELRKFVDGIPEDIKHQLKLSQQNEKNLNRTSFDDI